MDLIQLCLFPSSVSLYGCWQSRPLRAWPDLCPSKCCRQQFKMSGLPCVLGAAADSPSLSFCLGSSPRTIPVPSLALPLGFSDPWLSELFRAHPKESFCKEPEANWEVGNQKNPTFKMLSSKGLVNLRWELTTHYTHNLGISAACSTLEATRT